MAERPKFGDYVVTVLRRSVASWHGADVWFALAAYFTILLLPVLATGFLEDLLGELVAKTIALFATGWLVILFFIVTPFRLWQEERYRLNLIEESALPKINVDWRVRNKKVADLVLTNTSTKTIPRIEVSFRNWRKADGSDIVDILSNIKSIDGKGPEITLDPLVQTFFRFAGIYKIGHDTKLTLTPSDEKPIRLSDREIGVKLTVSGEDIPGAQIQLRLIHNDDDSLSIEPWGGKESKAVSLEGTSR